jgi:hypothetical protein
MDTIDPFNKYGVALASQGLMILMPPRVPMSDDEAVELAAWLVSMAVQPTHPFDKVLEAIQNT